MPKTPRCTPWSAAVLGRSRCAPARAPAHDGQIVLGRDDGAALGAQPGSAVRLTLGSGCGRSPSAASPRRLVTRRPISACSSPTRRAQRRVRHPGTVDVIGLIGQPGVYAAALAKAADQIVPTPAVPTARSPRGFSAPAEAIGHETPDVAKGREHGDQELPSVFGLAARSFIAARA